jgi:hypothetical protein
MLFDRSFESRKDKMRLAAAGGANEQHGFRNASTREMLRRNGVLLAIKPNTRPAPGFSLLAFVLYRVNLQPDLEGR